MDNKQICEKMETRILEQLCQNHTTFAQKYSFARLIKSYYGWLPPVFEEKYGQAYACAQSNKEVDNQTYSWLSKEYYTSEEYAEDAEYSQKEQRRASEKARLLKSFTSFED